MSEYQPQWIPQGWQCPVCKRVYSPTTTMCLYCGDRETTVSTDGTGMKSLKQIWTETMRKDFDLTYAPRAGLEYWGFEIDGYYYQEALKRLNAEKAQISMTDIMREGEK